MDIEKQQEKLAGQIRDAEERLRRLKEKDSNLKKRAKEIQEKKLSEWTKRFDGILRVKLISQYGEDYFYTVTPEDAAEYYVVPKKDGQPVYPETYGNTAETETDTSESKEDWRNENVYSS